MHPRHANAQRNEHPGWRWTVYLLSVLLALGFIGVVHPGAARAEDASASLVVNVYTCESRNDPIDPTESLIDQCTLGTEDIVFSLESIPSHGGGASASTGTGGAPATISFTDLTPGDYRLIQKTPDSIALSYILQCTSTERTFDYPFSPFAIIEPGGRLNVSLLPGEQLTCDWYIVQDGESQPADAAALTITAYSCDGDVIGPDICDLAPKVDFTIVGANGDSEQLTTGPDGTVTFDGSGDYQLTPVSELPDRVFCAFEPYDAVSNGAVTLDPAAPIALDAYYCYPGA
jgi:hypothetical protein